MQVQHIPLLVAALVLAAMPSFAKERAPGKTYKYADVFCTAAGTVDYPEKDHRYVGPKVPEWIERHAGFKQGSPGYVAWRCENGKTLACVNGGITGKCDKQDTNRRPNAPSRNWCRQHPGADIIPALATGHWTVYDWYCRGKTPTIRKQYGHTDARGFDPSQWTQVITE